MAGFKTFIDKDGRGLGCHARFTTTCLDNVENIQQDDNRNGNAHDP